MALYGLGHIQDERLNEILKNKKYTVHAPFQPEEYPVKYYKVLIMHQNKFKGTRGSIFSKKSIKFSDLPDQFDLLIWGHEHDPVPGLEPVTINGMKFFQPGSSVITSLCPGEAKTKIIGIFNCTIDKMKEELPFPTTKPNFRFIVRTQRRLIYEIIDYGIILGEASKKASSEKLLQKAVTSSVKSIIEGLLKRSRKDRINNKKPLIRLKIENCPPNECLVEPNSPLLRFPDQIANNDIIKCQYEIKRKIQGENEKEGFYDDIFKKKNINTSSTNIFSHLTDVVSFFLK